MTKSDNKNQTIISENIVEVTRRQMKSGPASSTVRDRAFRLLHKLGCVRCELSVVLCNDEFIRILNRDYRHKDKPTDVLSFPMGEEGTNRRADAVLGDVIISVDTARRQAAERNVSLVNEVTALLIHGVLHLIGFTHENDEDEAEMNTVAKELIECF